MLREMLEHGAGSESDATDQAYRVMVECRNATDQAALIQQMQSEGRTCKAL